MRPVSWWDWRLTSPSVSLTVGNAAPAIASFTPVPAQPVAGAPFTFTLVGVNFDPTKSTVAFSGPGCASPCSVNAPGSATQVAGSATLTSAGTYQVTVTNGTTGLTSPSVSLTVGNAAPAIASLTTDLAQPIGGTPFIFSVTGANLDPNNSLVAPRNAGCGRQPVRLYCRNVY